MITDSSSTQPSNSSVGKPLNSQSNDWQGRSIDKKANELMLPLREIEKVRSNALNISMKSEQMEFKSVVHFLNHSHVEKAYILRLWYTLYSSSDAFKEELPGILEKYSHCPYYLRKKLCQLIENYQQDLTELKTTTSSISQTLENLQFNYPALTVLLIALEDAQFNNHRENFNIFLDRCCHLQFPDTGTTCLEFLCNLIQDVPDAERRFSIISILAQVPEKDFYPALVFIGSMIILNEKDFKMMQLDELKSCFEKAIQLRTNHQLDIDHLADKYYTTFGHSRHPFIALELLQQISSRNDAASIKYFVIFFKRFLQETHLKDRYETQSEHLRKCFGMFPEKLDQWKASRETPLLHFIDSNPSLKDKFSAENLKQFEKWKLVDTVDPIDLLSFNKECESAGYRFYSSNSFPEPLLAILINAKHRLIAIKDEKGEIQAFSLVKLFYDERNYAPAIFMELYKAQSHVNSSLASVIRAFCQQRADEMKIPLLPHEKGNQPPRFLGTPQLSSFGDVCPFEGSPLRKGNDLLGMSAGFSFLVDSHWE